MTEWNSPDVIFFQLSALVKLHHAMGGVLIWEFLVNIEFDYSFFTGKRKFRPSFLLYLGARLCPLFAVIAIFVALDSAHPINCQVHIRVIFAHLSFAFASALIVMRIAAIWELNKIVISIASAAWLASAGSQIHSIAIVHATWSKGLNFCEITNTGGIWWLLYSQGLAWMIVVFVAEVFVLLNLNGVSLANHATFLIDFPLISHIMAIGASRVYRGLADYFLHSEAIIAAMNRMPTGHLVSYSGRCSLELETANSQERMSKFNDNRIVSLKSPSTCQDRRPLTRAEGVYIETEFQVV
ncbi:hypothetical protein EI94DRAFT_1742812 [Lactarius quietus]|nr:hypothetical protein EI94DRAFT_1742812 [Lactarius quietus]